MAYLIAIGAFPKNKGGFGSRGWHIWRRGSHVHTEHGGVKIENHGMKTVRWDGYPTEIVPPLKMRTVKRAIAEMKRQIALKLKGRNGGEPYKRLPRGHKVLPHLVRDWRKFGS